MSHPSHIHIHIHRRQPANKPIATAALAALLKLHLDSAPLAAGEVVAAPPVDTDTLAVAPPPVVPVVFEPPIAAAWNAAKVLSAVGFTAKTIPLWQCLCEPEPLDEVLLCTT